MRKRTGKRYNKILACVLAAGLMLSSIPMDAQASSVYPDSTYTQSVEQTEDSQDVMADLSANDSATASENNTTTASADRKGDTAAQDSSDSSDVITEESVTSENATEEDSAEENAASETTTESTEQANWNGGENASDRTETTDDRTEAADDQTEEADASDAESGDEIDPFADADGVAVYAAEDGVLTLDELAASGQGANIVVSADAITAKSSEAMILVSNLKASELDNRNITIDLTGDVDLTGTVTLNGADYTYHGMGTEENPYTGTLTSKANMKIDKTLFGVISSKAKLILSNNSKLIWKGTDNTQSIYADTYIFADEEEYTLAMNMQEDDGEDEYVLGNFIGTIAGKNGILTISNLNYTLANTSVSVLMDTSAGLICNTLESGTVKLTSCKLPANYTVTSKAGHAGGFVGEMADGTQLIINAAADIKAGTTIDAKTAGKNAGGIVGQMGKNATLQISSGLTFAGAVTAAKGSAGGIAGQMGANDSLTIGADVSLAGCTISGYEKAGGIAGEGENTDIRNANGATLTVSSVTIKETISKALAYVGGVYGKYTATEDQAFSDWIITGTGDADRIKVSTNSGYNKVTDNGCDKSGCVAGGIFGELVLKNSAEYSVKGSALWVDKDVTVPGSGCGTAYGAVAGIVTSESSGTDKNAALIIKTAADSYTVNSKPSASLKTYYHGGLIGKLDENVYLAVKDTAITVWNPFANDAARGFGGVVGRVCSGSVMKLDGDISLATNGTSDKKIWEGGGIAGWAEAGSAIELNGTTDLSGAYFVPMYTVGLLVAYQESALIYARGDGNGNGWTYKRAARKHILIDNNSDQGDLDDIGNYGQVIRLQADGSDGTGAGLDGDLIRIDDTTHKVVLNNKNLPLTMINGSYQVPDRETFALLAILIQSKGTFNSWNGINYADLLKSNITLTKDIDLSGTGMYGLTRDDADTQIYTGIFDGGTHTLTLAIGELYGVQGDTKVTKAGSAGEVCRHTYQGIFAATGSGAKVQNLTIAGSIQINGMGANRYSDTGKLTFYAGGFTGRVKGNLTADNVTLQETINLSSVSVVTALNAGGLAGGVTEASVQLDLGANGAVAADTTLNIISNELTGPGSSKYDHIYAGGIIGSLSGGKNITVNCDNVSLAGAITNASEAEILSAGGLIGYSEYSSNNNRNMIHIQKIVVNGQTVTGGAATKVSGGALGYKWEDVTVEFATPSAASDHALVVSDANVTAENACVGGLVYRSSGKWTVNDRGIKVQKAALAAKDIGLLLGHMDIETDQDQDKALYLEFTSNWKSAYVLEDAVLSITGNTGIFDEIAAYTAADRDQIMNNGTNGIISLETEGSKGVDAASVCNTYENRTAYGKAHKTNECSRYYYNLYSINKAQGFGTSGNAATPERLLAWSIWKYVPSNLKNILFTGCGFSDSTKIGGTSETAKAKLDMEGLSYYPVSVNGVTVQNSVITFYNSEIEACESENKSTTVKNDAGSQHYMMHCGLFYDMTGSKTAEITASVENVTFAGTVGRGRNNCSGALCSGTVAGGVDNSTNIYTFNISKVELDNLCVTGAEDGEYAPMLVNKTGGYISLSLSNVTAENYTGGKVAGSSLMGKIGNERATQISLTFHAMILPDKTVSDGGIFTGATFLESYQYSSSGVSSAVYNFKREEDWKTDGSYIHDVTYGMEIDGSAEYEGLQTHYYDKETYTTDDGLVTDQDGSQTFGKYLPYVKQPYDSSKNQHEIKVNQRINDLIDGCGTYGHPYILQSALDFTTVAEYLATKTAKQDWKIKVTVDQNTYHISDSSETDIVYRYDSTSTTWKEVEDKSTDLNPDNWVDKTNGSTLSNDIMHMYIQSAYYDVQTSASSSDNTVEVRDFVGFGTVVYPFRGVITSTKQPTPVTVKLTGASRNLITYSYGSVIRNINVEYSGGITVTGDDDTVGTWQDDTICYQTRDAFWGGVIGSVLGGDNIIDNVSVTMTSDWKLTLDGEKNYLIQVGGYVGSVAGGGVIFRNMTNKTGLIDANLAAGTNAASKTVTVSGAVDDDTVYTLYVNPFVGRVLDGYAFSEDCDVNNGTKTYKVNRLDSAKSGEISTIKSGDTYTTEISSAQGLLVFSAIVNSGGASGVDNTASGAGTLAYYGGAYTGNTKNIAFGNGSYGKVRNADYAYIGKTAEEAESDFAVALSDDRKTPGCADQTKDDLAAETNAPYLVTKYADGTTFYVCSQNAKTAIKLTNADKLYDMTGYGNGYQGISVRYISNAINNGSEKWDFSYGLLKLRGFDGNGSTIKVNMNIREYADDDFPGASFGGVFNLIRAEKSENCGDSTDGSLVKDLKMDQSNVNFKYINADGTDNVLTTTGVWEWTEDQKSAGKLCVSVGGFAGNTVQNGLNGQNENTGLSASYLISRFSIQNSTITGPYSAGGFMGSAGMGDSSNSSPMTAGIGWLYRVKSDNNTWNSFGVNLVNCTYDTITVTGGITAGGFVGFASGSSKDFSSSTRSIKNSLSVTDSQYSVTGKNSTIRAKYLSKKKNDTDVNGASAAGGVFGRTSVNLYINDTSFTIGDIYSNEEAALYPSSFTNMTIDSKRDSGAAVGYAGANECKIYKVAASKTDTTSKIQASRHAGGIAGCINTGKPVLIDECTATGLAIIGGANGSAGILGGFEDCYASIQKVSNCQVEGITATASAEHCAAGGLIGNMKGNKSNAYFVVEGCSVTNSTVGDTGHTEWNGGLIGSMSNNNNQYLYVYDSVVKNTDVYIRSGGGGAGGLTCSANGTVYCSNILLDDVDLHGSAKNIAAFVDSSGNAHVLCADGISIKNCNLSNLVGIGNEASFQFGTKSYVAFADYTNEAGGKSVEKDAGNLLDIDRVASPYVVTSPKSSLSVSGTAGNEYLHGDGASWSKETGAVTTVAKTIWDEKDNTAVDGRFFYKDIGVTDFDFTGKLSTYNSNQKKVNNAGEDFPVLLISGGNVSCISDYLDILTNGGYSKAVACNKTNDVHVTAKTEVYEYDTAKGSFVKNDKAAASLSVTNNETSSMSYKASKNYDNDNDRFTLLTVTWKSDVSEDISEVSHEYSIQIPVIVKRILEIDFVATLGYGTHFRSLDYDAFEGHVLDSFGNPMTGYLTYIYNSKEGKQTEYGWNNYIEAGGDITGRIDKKIRFSTELPAGTQLTMVDCQDANRIAYYYTITDSTEQVISLNAFTRPDNGEAFAAENIGEALGTTVTPDNAGLFIEVDETGKPAGAAAGTYAAPTVYLDGRYYRLADAGETGYQHYIVSVDETDAKENYYLVITMPKTENVTAVNGWLGTEIDLDIPHNVNYMLRDMKTKDGHSNTASTYQISDGYQQRLTETLEGASSSKALSASDSIIKISVRDEITFSNDQVYNVNDQLYQRFAGSLQTSVKGEDGTDRIGYESFPNGTTGKVRFYVYTLNGTNPVYYVYDPNQNSWGAGQDAKEPAAEYTWISTGGNMNLPLSTDGTNDHAISLQQLRDKVQTSTESGTTTTFYVEAVLDATIPASGLGVIPVSTLVDGVPQNYAKLNYVAQLSTEKESLSYSSIKDTLTNTKVRYYQEDPQGADLIYDADDIDQLGINLLDLQNNLDKDKKNVIIGTTARFDLSAMQNLENVLRSSKGIRFRLTLSKKNTTDQESYDAAMTDAEDYMTMKLVSPDSGTAVCENGAWTWTIPSSTYLADDKLKTGVIFDGSVFTQAIDLYVNVENVEDMLHLYSNYKVELTAEILKADGTVEISDTDNVIYTLTKIKPEFTDNN